MARPHHGRTAHGRRPLLRLTKGVHLVTPPATRRRTSCSPSATGACSSSSRGWATRWLARPTPTTTATRPTRRRPTEDVEYLVDEARQAFPDRALRRDPLHLGRRARPGPRRGRERRQGLAQARAARSRQRDGIDGIVSVVGGKITGVSRHRRGSRRPGRAQTRRRQRSRLDHPARPAAGRPPDRPGDYLRRARSWPRGSGARARAANRRSTWARSTARSRPASWRGQNTSRASPSGVCPHQPSIARRARSGRARRVGARLLVTCCSAVPRSGSTPARDSTVWTTSRRHLSRPARLGRRPNAQRQIDGVSTGARADAPIQPRRHVGDGVKRAVLALDQGTTGTAALVFDADGTILGRRRPRDHPELPAARLGRARPRGDLRPRPSPSAGPRSPQRAGAPRRRRDRHHQSARNDHRLGPLHGRPIHPAVVWQSRASAPISASD